MMFLPFHGTFFFNLGVCAVTAFVGFGGVAGTWAVPLRPLMPLMPFLSASTGDLPAATSEDSEVWMLPASWRFLSIARLSIFALTIACFSVSLLERALGRRGADWFDGWTGRTGARGVLGSVSSNQPASSLEAEPLSEECSLSSVPSLSQWRCSEVVCLVVCCRIQSSVSPRTGLRARLASIAALAERDG